MKRLRVKDLEIGDRIQMVDNGAFGTVVNTSIGWHPLLYRIELDYEKVRVWANYEAKLNRRAKKFRMCRKATSFIFR
jgi:hypothetical protein